MSKKNKSEQEQGDVLADVDVTPKLAAYKLAHWLEKVATEELTMQDAQNEMEEWWNSLSDDKKRELGEVVNSKAEQIRMIAEAVASMFYVISIPYRQ